MRKKKDVVKPSAERCFEGKNKTDVSKSPPPVAAYEKTENTLTMNPE